MKSNAFEELFNPTKLDNLGSVHTNLLVNKFSLPSWSKLKCPYCKEVMPEASIRSISIRLNPRNIGDLCVEFLCEKCEVGNTLYFVKEIDSMQDYADLMTGARVPKSEPITEEEMYKLKYHNTVEYMVQLKQTEQTEQTKQTEQPTKETK